MKRALGIAAVSAFAVIACAGPASAAAPDGYFNIKGTSSQGNCNAVGSSQITQNGQFVGSGDNNEGMDQTNAPGSRGEIAKYDAHRDCAAAPTS
jgi:hypothetical protein